jgi:PhnB protein
MKQIVPYLSYRDAPAALDFLCRAFGFKEESRYEMDDGRIGHAEITSGDIKVMLASVYEEIGFQSPLDLSGVHSQVYCEVADLDAHFEVARDAGATIAREPSDEHGTRQYRAVDPEGHRWIFAGPIR